MWKNVFIESCILSALIFGGFYINAHFVKKDISETNQAIQNEALESKKYLSHISGNESEAPEEQDTEAHLSGNSTDEDEIEVSPISGADQATVTLNP